MADLALRLKVFIASPSDVVDQRDVAEREIIALQDDCARERLLLEPFRWEGRTPPSLGPVQRGINFHLRTAELTVGIFDSTLGTIAKNGKTGSVEEIQIAGERVVRGYADDVFLYFKARSPGVAPTPGTTAVDEFRQRMMSDYGAFVGTFTDSEDFAKQFRQDLRLWAWRYVGVPEICAYALRQAPGGSSNEMLGENRLTQLKAQFDPYTEPLCVPELGARAIRMYQEHGPRAIDQPIGGRPKFPRLLEAGVLTAGADGTRFAHEEWFFFFCACGLLAAVAAGDVSAVERRPYVNQVHQYLQALALGATRQRMIEVLRRWLLSADGCTDSKPIARNFAACIALGMLNAIEAQDDLASVFIRTPETVCRFTASYRSAGCARVQLPVWWISTTVKTASGRGCSLPRRSAAWSASRSFSSDKEPI
jgi:hypothetical protein